MKEAKQFLFYTNISESLSALPREKEIEMVYAVYRYGAFDEEPPLSDALEIALFNVCRSLLDGQVARKTRAQLEEGGRNSHGGKRDGAGRPKKNQEPNQEQNQDGLENKSKNQDGELTGTELKGNDLNGTDLTVTASREEARRIVTEALGNPDFSYDFYERLEALKMSVGELERYIRWLFDKSKRSGVKNPNGWLYKCADKGSLISEFRGQVSVPPPPATVTCPVCGAKHEDSRDCPQCGLKASERPNDDVVSRMRADLGFA